MKVIEADRANNDNNNSNANSIKNKACPLGQGMTSTLLRDIHEAPKQWRFMRSLPRAAPLPICKVNLNSISFQRMGANIVGHMPRKIDDKNAAVKVQTGNNVQRSIGREIISKFGKPELLITDRSKELRYNNTDVYLEKQAVKHTVTTTSHPQDNSRVKQLSGSLVQALAKLTARSPED
ncbi:hypothetical protein DSO57_1015733 [Entomophthora muscae]|uniref:Uncharacterized protein n=1 Tax=Entomophthora muscae TaxID=34485 RepID=A0ACC2TSU2_9FUNG|nr:hypothetical protein DSO57_1015733 [Entomophthora muscae]